MAVSAAFKRRFPASFLTTQCPPALVRQLRSDATLEAIRKALENKTPNLVLYNYPSFSGAYGALFAHLYHSRLNLPCLILPFSAVVPFNVDDLCIEGMKTCYFLDFLGPKGFALELSRRTSSMVIGFDHRKSVLSKISPREDSDPNLWFHVNIEKSSSTAVYEYFSAKLLEARSDQVDSLSLLTHEDQERIEMILKYIEAGDLRKWNLPNIKALNIGLREWRSKLNCITNPLMYQQLTEICSADLIIKGNTYLSKRQTDASKLLHKVFRVKLGRGFYGECLGVRADGNSDFSDEMGKELSQMSAEAGLRPIGAVVYMQRNNLKMCLRTVDSSTDTSEIAKAYGGGGFPSSSSFIIRMDEYNQWRSMMPSPPT
ncbi:heat shock protein [Perilla frutescens var. frutescens]|nr:heat shock protein [Perilla frutescens var. frutescens]